MVSLLLPLIIALIVVGVLLWAVPQLPIDAAVANIIRVVIVVAVVLWLAVSWLPGAFHGSLHGARLP